MLQRFLPTPDVLRRIHRTIGMCQPETGGFLGSKDGLHIDHYYYDKTAVTSGTTYSPDVEAVNRVLRRWRERGITPVGGIHSHPFGCIYPSSGDIAYAEQIMKAWGTDSIVVVIAAKKSENDVKMTLYPYRIQTDGSVHRLPARGKDTAERFQRIEKLYPLEVLNRKTVVIVGVGGAAGFAEDLARSGVGNFVLIDPDTYSVTNIATQACFGHDLDRAKVEVVRERILGINPAATVVAVQRPLDNEMSDSEFVALVGDKIVTSPTDVLICGCTDSFPAQARSAALSIKLGVPYLSAQLYAGGEAGEIYFSYPGQTTGGCPRCAMRSRYEAYEHGFQNDVTSAASPIFATTHLNAMKGQIAMMLLLCGEERSGRYGSMLSMVADRNFVMLRFSPTAGEYLGLRTFDGAFDPALSFFGEPIWIPQTPDVDCTLCHGETDLSKLQGQIEDTRRLSQ